MAAETSLSPLENQVKEVIIRHASGATQAVLQESIPSVSAADLIPVINKFLNSGHIDLKRKGKQLVYAWKDSNKTKKNASSVTGAEEKLILSAIERADSNGVTAKDLKFSCNLPQPQITKFLKDLESKRMVKSVVKAGTRSKVYLLFDLEPSAAVTGGVFYNGEDFEEAFVNAISMQCYAFLVQAKTAAERCPGSDPLSRRRASFRSARDVCDYINGSKMSKIVLKVPDVEPVLNSLIYDAKVEKSVFVTDSSKAGENFYAVTRSLVSAAALMRVPCGMCTIHKDCGPGRDISPSTCQYMKDWLDF